MIAAVLAVAIALASVADDTAVRPVASPAGDPHLQTVRWREDAVVALVGHLGFQTMIRFSADERIENVAIGDATAWQVTPNKRADILFVKPIARARVTNMVVVTNQRTYTFSMAVALPRASKANAVWSLRFIVPEPVRLLSTTPGVLPIGPEGKNAAYTLAGPEALLPTRVFDDGTSTYFSWPGEATLPAIFSVNADGSEALVNFVVRDGYVAVQQVAGRFTLRQGDAHATVTSTPGVMRRIVSPAGH